MKPAHLKGILLALAAASVYGAVPNFARLAFQNGVPPLESVFFRTSAVAVVLGLVAVIKGENLRVSRAAMPGFLLQCLATLMVSACYLASVQFLPVTLSVIIFYLFPVIIVLAAPLVEGHFPGWLRIAVALLAFAGLVVAVGPAFESARLIGIILAFLGALGCALQFFSGRMVAPHLTPSALGGLVHLIIWPIIAGLALTFGDGRLVLFSSGAPVGDWAIGAVLLVCLAYLGGYFFHMSSVRAAPASVVAPYFNLEPILATVLAVFVLGEAMTRAQWIGGGMVFLALVIAGFLSEKLSP
jgi:drug/metabolite transporter (DMT)-like permease